MSQPSAGGSRTARPLHRSKQLPPARSSSQATDTLRVESTTALGPRQTKRQRLSRQGNPPGSGGSPPVRPAPGQRRLTRGPIFADKAPEVHCSVGTPWPPGLGAALKIARVVQTRGTQQTEIARRKSVRVPQSPHRHILRGPGSNAGKLAQLGLEGVRIDNPLKSNAAIAHGPGQDRDRFRFCAG